MRGDAMKGRVMNFIGGLSLVMCVGVCALWGRSYSRSDSVRWRKPVEVGYSAKVRTVMAYSGRGGLEMAVAWDRIYLPHGASPPRGLEYSREDGPQRPGDR